MAPRKCAAAAGEEDGPTLTLIVEKGPLSGEINVFRPGSLVRIGRLARGNTLCIKDSGISSKHLLIQFDAASDPDNRRWTITDLGSSNGTVLNAAQLDPSKPAALSDGDVVKIGELTSIRVKFEVNGAENKIEASSGNVRRNTRRRVRGNAIDLAVIEEDSELGLRNNEEEEEIEKVAVVEAKQGRNVATMRTRSSAKTEKLAKDLNVEEDINLGQSKIRGSRGVSTRRTRNARKEEDIEEDNTDLKASGIREVQGVSTRRTRSAKNDENVDEIGVVSRAIEDKKTRRGGRGRKKQHEETISEDTEKEESIPYHTTHEEEKERSKVGDKKVSNSGTENVAVGNTSSSLVQEGNEEETNLGHKTREEDEERSEVGVDDLGIKEKNSGTEGFAGGFSFGVKEGKRKMVPDLNNMSLGEWLDFLDMYEPQEIIDQTEEMLAEMRRKAEKCHEFRLQHKNTKAVE